MSTDTWQARALAAEARVDALVYEQRACHADKAELETKLLEAEKQRDAAITAANQWSAEHVARLAAEADVARLAHSLQPDLLSAVLVTLRRSREHQGHMPDCVCERIAIIADEQRLALAATPTPPAAVAALVRAAREVCDHYRDDHDLDVDPIGMDRIDNLRALLDAPPWRDVR